MKGNEGNAMNIFSNKPYAPEDAERLLILKNLRAWYTPGTDVLSDFSLDLSANEVIGLIGLNGAGKTTFLKTLSGLNRHFQAETALWKGQKLSFRDQAFKQSRYTVFAEDRSFQYFYLPRIHFLCGRVLREEAAGPLRADPGISF